MNGDGWWMMDDGWWWYGMIHEQKTDRPERRIRFDLFSEDRVCASVTLTTKRDEEEERESWKKSKKSIRSNSIFTSATHNFLSLLSLSKKYNLWEITEPQGPSSSLVRRRTTITNPRQTPKLILLRLNSIFIFSSISTSRKFLRFNSFQSWIVEFYSPGTRSLATIFVHLFCFFEL